MRTYTPSPEEWESAEAQARAARAPIIVGRDAIGLCAVTDYKFRFYMTDCCHAATTGSECGVVCKGCFEPVDPRLGGVPE